MNLTTLSLVTFIFYQLLTLNGAKGAESEEVPANFKAVQEELKAANVENTLLLDLGFGVHDEGGSQLNQIAKRLKERFNVVIILDLDLKKVMANYDADSNIIRISTNPDNIKELLSWKDSRIKTALFHEIRHAFLENTFDKSGKVTPLSGVLFGKNPGIFDERLNHYFKFLSFQEYSTFAQDMKLLSSSEGDILKHQVELFTSSSVFENFAYDTSRALEEIEGQLTKKTTKLGEKIDQRAEAKIRYLRIETPNWDLDLQIPETTSINKNDEMINLAKERIAALKNIIGSMRTNNQKIRALLGEKKPDIQKVKALIDTNQHLAKRSYRPFPTQCESYFSNFLISK